MTKWIIILILGLSVFLGGRWLCNSRNELNISGIVADPGCGETSPTMFKKDKPKQQQYAYVSVDGGVQYDNSEDWADLTSKARTENKYIMLFYVASYCGYCKKMQRDVFQQPEVASLINNSFIVMPLQVDETKSDPDYLKGWRTDITRLEKEHHINALPTLVICSPEGKIVDRIEGSTSAEEFVEWASSKVN